MVFRIASSQNRIKQSNLSKQDINCQRYEHFYHWLLSLRILWTYRGRSHFEHCHGKIRGYFEHFNSKHLTFQVSYSQEWWKMLLRTHSDTLIREKINFIFVIFVGLFWTPGNNLCYVYHKLFQISSKLLSEFVLSHLRKNENLSWIVLVFKLAPRFISRGYFEQSGNTLFVLR